MKWNAHELATVTHGTLYTARPDGKLIPASQDRFEREILFSIDTRSMPPGQVFVALPGEHADGHEYVIPAIQQGAAGVIISDKTCLDNPALQTATLDSDAVKPFILHVANPLTALQAIAHANRRKHSIPVVGITGSNGKTTVKDMAAAILATHFTVLKSSKSFNNHIGLPLTLANMTEKHKMAVLEMGMNAPGELTHLAGIAQPDVGVITNIAQAHFGFFHSLLAIMQAKMELIRSLPTAAVAVLNADDPLFESMRRDTPCKVVSFGLSAASHRPTVTARKVKAARDGTYSCELETPDGSIFLTLPLPGWHNVQNALAAAAIVYALLQTKAYLSGAPRQLKFSTLEAIQQGLERFSASPMRMQVMTRNGVTFLNDAYNANPNSMAAALNTLKSMACSGKKVAVLGDMLELGEISTSTHYEIGRRAADGRLGALLLLGEYAPDMARGAHEGGMAAADVFIGESHASLAAYLAHRVTPGDIVLLKASRGMTIERVLEEYMLLVKS